MTIDDLNKELSEKLDGVSEKMREYWEYLNRCQAEQKEPLPFDVWCKRGKIIPINSKPNQNEKI